MTHLDKLEGGNNGMYLEFSGNLGDYKWLRGATIGIDD